MVFYPQGHDGDSDRYLAAGIYSYQAANLVGCEYVAKYNPGCDPPFTTYHWGNGDSWSMQTQTVVLASAPYMEAYAGRMRAEGGGRGLRR